MRYFAHISKSCESDARTHGVMAETQKLAQRIEQQQAIDNLEFHDQFLKKALGRNFRLIIGKKYEGEDCLLVFWRVFSKGSTEYKKFCENSDSFLTKFEQVCTEENLQEVWAEKKKLPEIHQLTSLSDEEKGYLYQQNFQQSDDWLILETEDWIQRTDKETGEYSSYIASLHPLIIALIEHPQDKQEYFSENLGVLYRCLPDEKILYLIAPIKEDRPRDIISLRERHKKELEGPVDSEILLRKSKRAYPGLIAYEADLWIHGIQESDEKANLALSEEEAKVLRSREEGYPLFINGRPGSGKSTVLQYLFAEHLYHHLVYNELLGLPIYLTYNRELLEIAKENVFRILTSNAHKLTSSFVMTKEQTRAAVENSFVDFREYLSSLLPTDQRFDEQKHIDFPEFRLLFESRFSKHPDHNIRQITAELAWHVIRTYIKGTVADENEYLEPDAFRELPSKPQKSITNETYDTVYNAIWLSWYKDLCQKDGYWDDQDLARTLLMLATSLSNDSYFGGHPVIFCDEAQDFTRNELRLIFRLSLFSRRNLTPELFRRIPFAFAGDPFQTLNPTGFDWESTQTTFYQAIISQLDKRQKPTLDFNFRELSFNYRSTRSIVQLCNFIHLIRGIAFRKKDLRPQQTWSDEAANMPVYFDVSSPVLQSKLREQQEIVIIVPCQAGEEISYVQNDDFLSTLALGEDGKQITRNVLSPMRAKGQEFSRVVIYKFGEACWKDYSDLLELIEPAASIPELSQEKIVPLEYFINRLYVAASRSQKRLFIADTAQGLGQFWIFFEKYDLAAFIEKYHKTVQLSKSLTDSPWSAGDLVKIQSGDQSSWEQDHDDPAKLADEFFKSGLRLKDTYKLNLAIQNYRAAGKNDKELECTGWLYELMGEYRKAGECFEKLNKLDKALPLYWKAEAFDKVVRFDENSLDNKAAAFMLAPNERSLEESRDFLNNLGNAVKDKRVNPDDVWAKVIGTVIRHIIEDCLETTLPPYEWGNLEAIVQGFSQQGLLPKSEERSLEQLRVRATPYPEKLEILAQIRSEPRLIARYYADHRQVTLNDAQQDILLQALQALGQFNEVELLLDTYPSLKKYASLLATYIREKHFQSQIERYIQKLFLFLCDHGLWETALNFADKAILPVDEPVADVVRRYAWNNLRDIHFIKTLAVSESLLNANKSTKNEISKYLSERLIERASTFSSHLTVAQAGAALEKADRMRDSLSFYEMVFGTQLWPANEEDIQFAKERWLVCKSRQIPRQPREGSKRQIEIDIQKKQKEWGIETIAALSEYPNVDLDEKPRPVKPHKARTPKSTEPAKLPRNNSKPARPAPLFGSEDLPYPDPLPVEPGTLILHSPTSDSLAQVSITAGGQIYHCSVERDHGKLRIHYGANTDMLTISAKGLKARGSDEDLEDCIEQRERTDEMARYYVIPWQLTCVIRQQGEFVYVYLFQGEKDVDLAALRIA
jgi:hypothetical protein